MRVLTTNTWRRSVLLRKVTIIEAKDINLFDTFYFIFKENDIPHFISQ